MSGSGSRACPPWPSTLSQPATASTARAAPASRAVALVTLWQTAVARLSFPPDAVEEGGVAEQVPAPHPPWLDDQPEDPLEAVVGDPVRGPRGLAGEVVEQRAHGPHDPGLEAVEVA